MTPKEKKAFVKKMREAKEAKANAGKSTKTKGSKSNFSLSDYKKNEDINYHGENALQLVKKYGTKAELQKIIMINKRHRVRKYLSRPDGERRYNISQKYYKKLVADSKR